MNELPSANEGAAAPIDTTTSPADAAPADTAPTHAAPAATHGGQRQAFAPAGFCATGVGGRRVLWPVAIGAVSVVLAIQNLLAVVGYALHACLTFLVSGGKLLGLDPISSNLWPLVIMGLQEFPAFVGGLILLPAGLLVWRQGRHGPRMHVIYAISAILLNVITPVASFLNIARQAPDCQMEYVLFPIWNATVGMIYPVFLLIWFSRPNVKAETRLWR
jgi:hypothetical protein